MDIFTTDAAKVFNNLILIKLCNTKGWIEIIKRNRAQDIMNDLNMCD